MARQAGPLYFTGTIDDITFYKMEGEYFARKKSSLNRKQFRTDPRFARSRQSAARFGEASKLASDIYRLLPKEAKGKGVIGKLTGQVGRLLRQGITPENAIIQILETMGGKLITESIPVSVNPARKTLSSWKIIANRQLRAGITDTQIRKSPVVIHHNLSLSCEQFVPPSRYLT